VPLGALLPIILSFGVLRHFQQYLSYIVAVSVIAGAD
jgi:hypothetical protein